MRTTHLSAISLATLAPELGSTPMELLGIAKGAGIAVLRSVEGFTVRLEIDHMDVGRLREAHRAWRLAHPAPAQERRVTRIDLTGERDGLDCGALCRNFGIAPDTVRAVVEELGLSFLAGFRLKPPDFDRLADALQAKRQGRPVDLAQAPTQTPSGRECFPASPPADPAPEPARKGRK